MGESLDLYKALAAIRWELRNRRRLLASLERSAELQRERIATREEEERVLARRLLAIDPATLARVPRWRGENDR
jgi:hypothetical protein